MLKTFVIDTNVLLHNPQSLFVFEENTVVIPLAVIEEIDDFKGRQDEIGANARRTSRILDELRSKGDLSKGVSLETGGSLRIEVNHRSIEKLPEGLDVLDSGKPDNRILAVALNLKRTKSGGDVTLISKDLNLRLKADVLGLAAEDLINDKIDYKELYSGQGEIMTNQDEIDTLYREKALDPPEDVQLFPNQLLTLKSLDNPSSSALARCNLGLLKPAGLTGNQSCFGLKPRNREQNFALKLLLDPEIPIVTLAGAAGTGKTLLALSAALETVLERNIYDKILVTRPVIPLDGQDLGYLPGDKEEKLKPWMGPIQDNLEFLFRSSDYREQPSLFGTRGVKSEKGNMGMADYLQFTGQLEMEALTYIRGRSISRRFIVVDEAQNCTLHAVKTMLTRVGHGSKIVLTGDIDQVDHPYLDSASNGLSLTVEKIKTSNLSGHITLLKGERSPVADLGARML
jgi:PhoH-like ATPase